jgi:hypothetical protein
MHRPARLIVAVVAAEVDVVDAVAGAVAKADRCP